MDDFFLGVVSSTPGTRQHVASAAYQLLCLQGPTVDERIRVLMNRLKTATESGATDAMMLLLNTCASAENGVAPDVVETLVEELAQFTLEHKSWVDTMKWSAALFHFFATDAFTVSLFADFDVPRVALEGLTLYGETNGLVATACTVLLSHFNFYEIENGISLVVRSLDSLKANTLFCRSATRALAEFTSFFDGSSSERFRASCDEFVRADGVKRLEAVMRQHNTNEEIQLFGARIVANVISGAADSALLEGTNPMYAHLLEMIRRFPESEILHCHVLRALGSVPQAIPDVSVIADLGRRWAAAERVMQQIVRSLSSTAMHVKDRKVHIHSTGCIPIVLNAMRRYRENPQIQEEGCNLLSYLSFDSEVITSAITQADGIQLVLAAMNQFPKAQNLLTAACAALSGLTFNNAMGQRIVLEHNGIAAIINAMRQGDKARLQENGCLAIGTMCWNTDLKAEVVRLQGIPVIMDALEDHYLSSGLVKNACRALAQVAFNCERYRDEMSALGVIPLIVRAMGAHPHHDRAQMHGCVALSYLSWTNEANASLIVKHDGYGIIVEAMRNHPHNHEVQEHACRALANISNVGSSSSEAALEQIIAAMRKHERVAEVQEEACRAIVTLSLVSTSNKDKLFELNAGERVIAAMQNFPRVHLVQQEACNALAHLAYEHANLNRGITEQGGVALLLAAMRTHQGSPKVQLNACGGLSAVAFDNTVAQRQIYEQGGVELVLRAMKNFDRLRMLELGCSVLGTLAWNADIKGKVAVLAIPEILRSMSVYEDNALLQKSTCRAVSQFAFNSESNRRLLAENGAVPLIVKALKNHWQNEKLVAHALKALTYLCWENAVVAQSILEENVESALEKILSEYKNDERISNEAAHLSKILNKKTLTQSPSQRSPAASRGPPVSPPIGSPVPMSSGAASPTRKDSMSYNGEVIPPPSPPQQDKEELLAFYRAPADAPFSMSHNRHARGGDSSVLNNFTNSSGAGNHRRDDGRSSQPQQSKNGQQDKSRSQPIQQQGQKQQQPPVQQQQQTQRKQQQQQQPQQVSNNNQKRQSPPPQNVAPAATGSFQVTGSQFPTSAVFLEDLESALTKRTPQPQQQQGGHHVPLPKSKRNAVAEAPQASAAPKLSQTAVNQQQQQQLSDLMRGSQQRRPQPTSGRGTGANVGSSGRVHIDPEAVQNRNRGFQQQQQQLHVNHHQQPYRQASGYGNNQQHGNGRPQHQQQSYQQQNNNRQEIPADFSDPRFQKKDGLSSQRAARSGEDLWDDPEPGTFHGNRSSGAKNWQQEHQQQQQQSGGNRAGGYNNRRY